MASVTDGDSNVTQIVRDASGGIEKIISPYGAETIFATNAEGYISQLSDPNNEAYQFQYDSSGLMSRMDKPGGAYTTVTYDSEGFVIDDTDTLGLQFRVLESPNDDNLFIVETGLGRMRNVQSTMVSQQFVVTEIREEDGSFVNITNQGRNVFVDRPGESDYVRELQFDPFLPSNLITLNEGINFDFGESTDFVSSRDVVYQTPGDLTSDFTLTDTLTRNSVDVSSQVYDSATKTFINTSAEGRVVTRSIDDQERTTSIEVAGLLPIAINYDSRGRLESITQGDRTTGFEYDSSGYLAKVINAEDQETSFVNDGKGQVTQQRLADNRVIDFDYDGRGNLIGITPPGKGLHQLDYNLQDLLTGYDPPTLSGRATSSVFTYNTDKDLIRMDRADGQFIDFIYNNKRQITSQNTNSGSTSFDYNSVGKPQAITSEDGVAMGLNYIGERISSTNTTGVGLYNRSFGRNLQVSSDSAQGSMLYDRDDLLTSLAGGQVQLVYSPINGLLTGTSISGYSGTYSYSGFGELSQASYRRNAIDLFSDVYTRDKLGRITEINEVTTFTSLSRSYAYDLTGRLVSATDGQGTTTYTYDSNSNITQVSSPSGVVSATYDEQDRLLTFGNLALSYNDHGELSRKVDSSISATTNYSYDSYGNLKQVNLPSGEMITYQVDGLNRRVRRLKDGVISRSFIYKDQLNPVQMLRPGSSPLNFIYGTKPNVPDMILEGANTYFVISDHLGSVREVRNSFNQVVQRLEYDAYGKVLVDTNPGFQPFGFAGGIYDSETGLTRFGARDYDASVMRWTAKDPILFEGGDANLYSYALNDPINSTDLDGLRVSCSNANLLITGGTLVVGNLGCLKFNPTPGCFAGVSLLADGVGLGFDANCSDPPKPPVPFCNPSISSCSDPFTPPEPKDDNLCAN